MPQQVYGKVLNMPNPGTWKSKSQWDVTSNVDIVIIIRPKVGKDNEILRNTLTDGDIKMVQSSWEKCEGSQKIKNRTIMWYLSRRIKLQISMNYPVHHNIIHSSQKLQPNALQYYR